MVWPPRLDQSDAAFVFVEGALAAVLLNVLAKSLVACASVEDASQAVESKVLEPAAQQMFRRHAASQSVVDPDARELCIRQGSGEIHDRAAQLAHDAQIVGGVDHRENSVAVPTA